MRDKLKVVKEWIDNSRIGYQAALDSYEERGLTHTTNYHYVRGLRDFAKQALEIVTIEENREDLHGDNQ